MSRLTDPDYLKDQYHNSSNLDARIDLHRRFSTNKHGWYRWVFDQYLSVPQGRIVELGCGSARTWADNRDRIPSGWEVILTDISTGMLDDARENLRDAAHPIGFELVDAQSLPFAGESFDAVIANH